VAACLVAVAAVAAGVVAGAGSRAGAALADPPPVDGSWSLTFTPRAVRLVGRPILRGDSDACEGACSSQYQYAEAGTDVEPYRTFLSVDGSGCAAAPCTMPAGSSGAGGFTGTVSWDGTTYTAEGKSAFTGSCAERAPAGTDTMRFTIEGNGPDARLTGEATLLLSWVVVGNGEECRPADGYELYSGTLAGTFASRRPGSTAGPTGSAGPAGSAGEAAVNGVAGARGARHDRPALATAVADARSLPWSPSRLAVSAFLALLLVLLMPFPAALFNSTLEENYDEVRGWFSFVPRRDPERPRPLARDFALVVVVAAVLNAFLDPGLRLDSASALLVAGLVLSITAVSLLAVVPSRLLSRERPTVRVFPLGLAVAAVCVLVSRVTSFEPGYLYGVIAGFAFAQPLRDEEKGRLTFWTAAFLLAVAAVVFVARVPVHSSAADGATAWVLADTVLAAVFAAGVEANVLGLLPLRFLDGESLLAWRRGAWAAAFGLSVFAFLHALSARAGEDSATASVVVAVALFGSFATVSVTFWAYFRYRPAKPTPASV
jgi:hypothetical protein